MTGLELMEGPGTEPLTLAEEEAASIDRYLVEFESGDRFEGAFQVTALDFAGAYNAARTFTLSLDSSGPVSFQAAA